jgi:peptidoglycan hydrolase-like protein with peptidoglycan-binding domain
MKGATMKMGDRGSDVKQVQAKLGITADGRFGPNTLHAVEAFQATHGLIDDGVVAPDTQAALGI